MMILGKNTPYHGSEDKFQTSVARYLSYNFPKCLWFHTPNGGYRNKLEAAKFKKMGVLPGVSDVIILDSRHGYSGLIIELKTKKNTVQDTQKDFLIKASDRGFLCYVCYNMEMVMKVVEEYFNQ